MIFPLVFLLAAAASEPAGLIRFEDVSAKAGIGYAHSFGSQKLGSLLESTGAGCAWFDYNNDGRLDLYIVTGRPLSAGMHPYPLKKMPAAMPHNRLFHNNGDGTFTDVTAKTGVATDLYSMAAVSADYDNDGFADLLVTGYGRSILYHNKGDGTFEDVTAASGFDKATGWTIGSAWLDYDKDGCLDAFVGRYVKFDPKYRAYYAADNYPGPLDYAGDTNLLFKGNCKGSFTDVSEKAGLAEFKGRTMGATAGDLDNDGWPDIYVANDKTENYLFRNKGDGTFEEVATEAGAAFGQNGESTSAMGPVFLDFDGDGKTDLWVSDSKYNRLLRATGSGVALEDVSAAAGVSQATAQYVSWGTGFYDFDNDTRPDLFIVHGGLAHMVPQEHSMFRNTGDRRFADVSSSAGTFFDTKTVGRGACFADYDNDGKMDAYVVNLGAPGSLVRNTSSNGNHWIALKLVGKKSNRDGIGSRIELAAGGRRQIGQRIAGCGYLGQDDGRVHFGLGTAAKVDELTITWPSGKVQTMKNVNADGIVTVEEQP